MKKAIGFVLGIIIAGNVYAEPAAQPVYVGGSDLVDACSGYGHVVLNNDGDDAFLAVKNAPDLKALRVDKLLVNSEVWLCDESLNGQWIGIVYTGTDSKSCNVSSPIKDKAPYKGPCKSGWVYKKYISNDAG